MRGAWRKRPNDLDCDSLRAYSNLEIFPIQSGNLPDINGA